MLTAFGDPLTRRSYDWLFSYRKTTSPQETVIIYLDEVSHRELQQPLDCSWDRSIHAELVEKLTAENARCVVFDIVFDTAGRDPAADLRFAQAIQSSGKVVLAGFEKVSRGDGGNITRIRPPLESFRAAAAKWGLTSFPAESDQAIRRHPISDEEIPSLSAAAASFLQVNPPLGSEKWINYYGPPGTLQGVSYYEVMRGLLPPGFFRDKVVFVGSQEAIDFTGARKDAFGTSYSWMKSDRPFSSGVEIQATALLNLLRGDWLKRPGLTWEILTIMIFGFFLGFGLCFLSTSLAALCAFFLGTIVTVAIVLCFNAFIWFSWLIVFGQICIALAWSVGLNSVRSYVEKHILTRSLQMHLPASRVKQILDQPDLLRPGAEKQEVSMLFTDIADFSTISDRMAPDKLFRQLNTYFEETIPSIHEKEGTVIQIIGDAIFALWNAPEPQKNHQELACGAALSLKKSLAEFDIRNESFRLKTRVGLHAGSACVGNSGSAERVAYTALGANTNLASRLESLNKHLGTEVLASTDIKEAAEKKFAFRSVGDFRFKGIDRVIEIFELLGELGCAESREPWLELFAQGLRHFKRGEFDAAATGFKKTLLEKPKDGPTLFYLAETYRHCATPPRGKWFGEINMADK